MKPSEILRAGLNLLETRGWTQHDYAKDKNGNMAFNVEHAASFCGLGAMRVSAFGELYVPSVDVAHPYSKARTLLNRTISPTLRISWTTWQDKPNRTFAEVELKFLEAIQLAEQQEQAA